MLRRAVRWFRDRPTWQQVAILLAAIMVAWSILEALPDGRTPFATGSLTVGEQGGGTTMALQTGWRDASGAIHLEYAGSQRNAGVIIDGMDVAGMRGTVTWFEPVRRTYADLPGCTASFEETAAGSIAGSIECEAARIAPSDGATRPVRVRFTAAR